MKKRILSILLAVLMVLSAAPAMAFTASAATENYKLVFEGDQCYKNVRRGDAAPIADLGISITGSASAGYTYTFNNVNFTTSMPTAIEFKNDATIVLKGTNTITGGDSTTNPVKGIDMGSKKLTIEGDGSLTLTTGTNPDRESNGIYCDSDIIINGGNTKIVAGKAKVYSYGVTCDNFTMKKGKLEIYSGETYNSAGASSNYALLCREKLLMEGGELTCVSAKATAMAGDAFSFAIDMHFTATEFSVSGGKITATCNTASGGASKQYAVYSEIKPDAKAVAAGTVVVLDYDATWHTYKYGTGFGKSVTLTSDEEVAQIGTTNYPTVAAALEAVGEGTQTKPATGTIKLIKDVTEDVTIGEYQNIVLDLNGYALTAKRDVAIKNCGKLTVIDSSEAKTGKIMSDEYGIFNDGSGDLTVTDIKIICSNESDGDYVYGILSVGTCQVQGDKTEITVKGACVSCGLANGKTMSVTGGKITASGSGDLVAAMGTDTDGLTIGDNAEFFLGTSTATLKGAMIASVDYTVTAGKFNGPIVGGGTAKVTITGGSFTEDPTAMVDTAKYQVLDNGQTAPYRYTVISNEICEYNATKYPSVAMALAAIGDGTESQPATGTIKLLNNDKESVVIGQYQDITLDLNGYTLANKDDNVIINKGKLAVIDSGVNKTGKITSNAEGIINRYMGDLTVTDISINIVGKTECSTPEGIYNTGVCKIQGNTTITASGNGYVYALYNFGIMSVTGGKFTASGSGDYVAAIGSGFDTLTIGDDAEFILGTSTATNKAALGVEKDYTITAGKFNGPIVGYDTAKVTVTGGSFSEDPTAMVDTTKYDVTDNGAGVTYRYTVMQDIPARFAREKDRICSAFDELGETYDGCFATRDIRKAKEAVNNYQYDESKSYEENVAALEAIFTKTAEKVVKRHNFIYGCPFMTLFARMVEWILDIFKITL